MTHRQWKQCVWIAMMTVKITIAGITVWSLSVAVETVKSFRYSLWECFKESIRSCSADPYKSWRTAHGSSSAHGKPTGTVPHCIASSSKGGLLFSFFFPSVAHLPQVTNHLCFFCSHLYFDLPGILTLHTSVSILSLICCTFPCQPCTYGRSLVPVGHPGLDHKEESR